MLFVGTSCGTAAFKFNSLNDFISFRSERDKGHHGTFDNICPPTSSKLVAHKLIEHATDKQILAAKRSSEMLVSS